MSPTLSIIIPAYNAQKTIDRTLHSMISELDQAVKLVNDFDYEIIIVNDGSTDYTSEVVEVFLSSKVRLINIENSGVSNARNYGLKYASGEYIWFFDADDLLFEKSVIEVAKLLQLKPDILRFLMYTLDKRTKKTIDSLNNCASYRIAADEPYGKYLSHNNIVGHSCFTVIIRRILIIEKSLFFDSSLSISEDVLWNLTIAERCPKARFVLTNLNVVKYVVTSSSAINTTDYKRNFRHFKASLSFKEALTDRFSKVPYLSRTVSYYQSATLRQLVTRFLSSKLSVNEAATNAKIINKLIEEGDCQDMTTRFFKLISKNGLSIFISQFLYREIFLPYIKPLLTRN